MKATQWRLFRQIIRHFGLGWVVFRVRYALIQRFGGLRRRLPATTWEHYPLAELFNMPSSQGEAICHIDPKVAFFFQASDRLNYSTYLREFDQNVDWPQRRLNELAAGRVSFFSDRVVEVGWPPNWHVNPVTLKASPKNQHFSDINEFAYGDVKAIWETNRFAFVYDLVRIYWRTGDAQCVQLFWQAIEDWRNNNPPHTGVNWKCGQEASIRAMAWCFGLWAFADSEHTTDQRVAKLVQMLAVTANRVRHNLSYALSQHNNHGISEANGLWTIGLLFPQLKDASRWRELGRRALESEARILIDEDGSFSQHSANYHRVMLDQYHWAIRLGELNSQPLSDALRQRVNNAGRFIIQIMDHESGSVPRYGQDDGAQILPLTETDYFDFRPAAQSAKYLSDRQSLFGDGPWNERLLWLFGPDALRATRCDESLQPLFTGGGASGGGGCHVVRSEQGMALNRCQQFRYRPSQMDQLHTDIWWKRMNIALDPGTYSYNSEGLWSDIPLSSAHCHNTVTVDDQDQADRASRFMHLPWPRGHMKTMHRSALGSLSCVVMEHEGYRRLDDPITHHRVVIQVGVAHWVVVDRLQGQQEHTYRLHWLLRDSEHQWDVDAKRLSLQLKGEPYIVQVQALRAEVNVSMVRGDAKSCRGWYAPCYGRVEPALSLAAEVRATEVMFISVLGPGDLEVEHVNDVLHITGPHGQADLQLNRYDLTHPAVSSVSLHGPNVDRLEID